MLLLNIADKKDLVQLGDLAVNAFSDDELYRPDGISCGHPPRLDDLKKHEEWLDTKTYLKCTKGRQIVGSCILFIEGLEGTLFGLNVGRQYMNMGIGSWIINKLQHMYPQVKIWTLETPDYATRNHHFYEKNGFKLIEITEKEQKIGFGFHKYIKLQTEVAS